jgi:hypothetical protein
MCKLVPVQERNLIIQPIQKRNPVIQPILLCNQKWFYFHSISLFLKYFIQYKRIILSLRHELLHLFHELLVSPVGWLGKGDMSSQPLACSIERLDVAKNLEARKAKLVLFSFLLVCYRDHESNTV